MGGRAPAWPKTSIGARHDGRARRVGHRLQGRHRPPARRRRRPVRRRVRQAARGGRPAEQGRRRRPDQPSDLRAAAAAACRGSTGASANGRRSARRGGCGRATPRSGPARTKRSGSAGSASPRISWPTSSGCRVSRSCARSGGFTDVLLLGMGGSSLCPEVLKATFGKIAGFPELHVLDSTDPAQVKTFEHTRRSDAHAVHRVEQVGLDARAEHLQAVLLRPRGAARRPPAGGPPLRRHHRSRLDAAAGRRTRRVPRASSSAGRRSADATRRSPTSAWCPRR